jgi:hypothetical protein
VPAANGGHEGRAADRAGPAAGVETDQDETREMPAHRALGTAILHDLICSPCRSNQVRGLLPRQPDISALRFLWQHYRHDFGAKSLSPVVIDRRAKVLELAPCGSLGNKSRCIAGLLGLRRSPLLANPPSHVFTAPGAVHVRERVGLPEVGQCQASLLRLVGPRVLRCNIGEINIQNVKN